MAATTMFDDLRAALGEQEFDGAAVGIDLGTTKSCVAVARFEEGEILCDCVSIEEPGQPEGQIAVPSVVAVKDGSVYRQASEWPMAGFNLALLLHKRKRHQEALEVIDQVLERSPQPAYLVLKGDIVAALGQQSAARLLHQDAVGRVVDSTKQSVWSLGWLTRCARSLGHEDLGQKFREASAAQIEAEEDSVLQGALLPERGDNDSAMRAAA